MSNPTPILNNINAFDATKGTTISFNIIGGTDIVRSNIVYIYDLSTNDLICTHLYISTESIHELPPNTDPSIVYADGKSSADFVNNKNYYLQIQTFTNTAGTAGGSGMSVAKTFWCLFDPALSVNAIPAAISTTSYNVSATYTTNITDVTIPVTNIIQQYKFDLYTATGTLVQTSGNIIGSGEQEGTSTTYNITYNFSGLVVNNSYYVVVTTTSTEGMTVSAQSNTFTVSIDTPTVGGATVNNNACDGYISVVSNLSDEYSADINKILVKRQDTSDTSGKWLTLYSQPITQASDMDFTYIDFLNQHGKTYRYALVPLLTQQQGDIDVEIEGGYTVSDDVLSVFDGVFIANNNGSQKLKAATEYGDLETNQDVGVLTTIGGKYPFVVSNSNLNYHSGSISALIVPSDFYTNGDLDRLDIVERREAMEQFLTDKTAKILKDWNGNIWLITFVENVEVSFVDDYGMGLGTLSAKWVEIGDVNDQTDLQQTGLI